VVKEIGVCGGTCVGVIDRQAAWSPVTPTINYNVRKVRRRIRGYLGVEG